MTATETGSPCDFHCGYVGPPDQDFRDHIIWEHRASCTDCGARKGLERWSSLTHRLDCPRLQPGYVYPPLDGEVSS